MANASQVGSMIFYSVAMTVMNLCLCPSTRVSLTEFILKSFKQCQKATSLAASTDFQIIYVIQNKLFK